MSSSLGGERHEPGGRRVDVDTDHVVGVGAPHERRHDGAVVAALGAVAVVAQPGHELDEGAGHPVDGPAGAGEGAEKANPGMEGTTR